MSEHQFDPSRLEDLLADRALFGLSDEEQQELARLMASSSVDPESYERVVAMMSVVMHQTPLEPIPAQLTDKLLKSFDQLKPFGESNLTNAHVRVASPLTAPEKSGALFSAGRREIAAWLMVALLIIAVPVVLWSQRLATELKISASDARQQLIKDEDGLFQSAWTTTADPDSKNLQGDLVWSNPSQRGFMSFQFLPKNDPKKSQYQLWIFDSQQDERYPIDGGVFNIDSDENEVIVPIHAKLRVVDPKMFAVTVEKPGGVVVSDRSRLVAIAKVDLKR